MPSPIIKKRKATIPEKPQFTWQEAVAKMLDGKKMHKLEWKNPEYYGFIENEVLMLHKPDGNHQWILSKGDLIGTDYVEL